MNFINPFHQTLFLLDKEPQGDYLILIQNTRDACLGDSLCGVVHQYWWIAADPSALPCGTTINISLRSRGELKGGNTISTTLISSYVQSLALPSGRGRVPTVIRTRSRLPHGNLREYFQKQAPRLLCPEYRILSPKHVRSASHHSELSSSD